MMTWAFLLLVLLLVPSFLFLTFDQISLIAILFVYKWFIQISYSLTFLFNSLSIHIHLQQSHYKSEQKINTRGMSMPLR